MYKSKRIYLYIIGFVLFWANAVHGQVRPNLPNSQTGVGYDSQGRPIKKSTDSLSLKHRDANEDSITISFKYFDSSRINFLDSSINDFRRRYPVPYTYNDLGNFGTATYPLLFTPNMKPGWDAGFHAFDPYMYKLEETKFYTTTRPYTDLAYMIGSKAEQMINLTHTQNRGSNFNFTFDYRFINSPGTYRNQNTSHSNIRVNAFYQSNNKRYGAYLIYILNSIKSSENGGLIDEKRLDSLTRGDPFELLSRLGNRAAGISRNFFNTNVATGNQYNTSTIFFRHYYDLGSKDSLVTDSVTYKLFYPRLRLQHTFSFTKYQYSFRDYVPTSSNYSAYFNYYNPLDTVLFKDVWQDFTNEFSLLTFPEKKNLNQFLKLGAAFQFLKGQFDTSARSQFSNTYLVGEYRNRTRNQKWDIEANGRFYITGSYVGDYAAYISLKRILGKKIGSLEVGFQNVNRTPSYLFENRTSFPVTLQQDLKKENTTRIFANLYLAALKLQLSGNYYLVSNYTYFDNFFNPQQEGALFNMLQLSGEKKFRLSRFFNWYAQLHVQQATGNPPVAFPSVLTRNRLAFEGNFFTNLFLSTGVEIRYYTSFKPYNYSPFTGQFFYQDTYSVSNRPDVDLFFHFRIKSFKSFVRLENVNSFSLGSGTSGAGFNKPNFTVQHYPGRAMWLRFGFWWGFVN